MLLQLRACLGGLLSDRDARAGACVRGSCHAGLVLTGGRHIQVSHACLVLTGGRHIHVSHAGLILTGGRHIQVSHAGLVLTGGRHIQVSHAGLVLTGGRHIQVSQPARQPRVGQAATVNCLTGRRPLLPA